MTAELAANRYGKSGIRLATVARDGDTHRFTDLEIEVRLEGDFTAAHTEGDNRAVLPTDTMRGTCYAVARTHGTDDVADYGRALVDRFLEAAPAVARARVELVAFGWEHLEVDATPHPHTFRPLAGGRQVTTVDRQRDGALRLHGGVRGFRILKTTGSAFSGFLRDEYTTLPETRDRIMATTVVASWGYAGGDVEHARLLGAVPATFGAAFARHDDSESLQHTLHVMGEAVVDAHSEIAWIRFRMPNEHHILSDLSPYGLDNPNEVFLVADKPFGVIEGTVVRPGHQAEPAW
jgi:urate oxidase